MALPELCILDIGHGNCGVVHAAEGVVIVDVPLGRTLVDFLLLRAITRIEMIIISHADADHVAGVTPLLLDDRFVVRKILVNPDATKETKVWNDFRSAAAVAEQRHSVHVSRDLGSNYAPITLGSTRIEILSPSTALALAGPGGKELDEHGGRRMLSNSLSAVVRVVHADSPRALLAGDIDDIGFADLQRRSVEIAADLLVFPHHGGHIANADNSEFARRFCEAVGAKTIVFSIGRGKHGTPRPEIVKAVESTLPGAHIACTQLSKRCAAINPDVVRQHQAAVPAQGSELNVTCIGTIIQDLATGDITPARADHINFVHTHAATHLCLGGADAATSIDEDISPDIPPAAGA
jgi:beta-lactamase superfamily II metal-dependent hydrolase